MRLHRHLALQALLAGFLVAMPAGQAASETRACSSHTCVYRSQYEVCSAFSDPSCVPDFAYLFDEQLQLTIETRDRTSRPALEQDETDRAHRKELDTIRAVFAALLSCWIPPAKQDSKSGTQLSVRLSFKRSGEIFGKPRITYVTPGLPDRVRQAYSDAVEAAIARCTPLPFAAGLGGALAGRPFAIRFVDRRSES